MYTALQLIKDEIKNAREVFQGTAADITQEQLHKDPGGKAFSIAATYAHLVFSEDSIVQGMIQKKAPLYTTSWKDKTGASSPIPPMDENWSKANDAWGRSVKINLDQIRLYTDAVFEATDAYVNSLKEEDLEKEVDLGNWGKKTVAFLLYSYVIGHMNNLAGELSALKGVQGAKGYPF